MLVLFILCIAVCCLACPGCATKPTTLRRFRLSRRKAREETTKPGSEPDLAAPPAKFSFRKKKPLWVKHEVIRLKALMPHSGCRKLADTFNRLYADRYAESVSKSYVHTVVMAHQHAIRALRRQLKHRQPRPLPKNRLWALDLTTVTDKEKRQHPVFGILDHGTRACLVLQQTKDKASLTLLRCLLDVIELYGKPKGIRTDNEAVFTSRLFRAVLWLLGIRHQRTEVACPWQNGRIERFFGTLKAAIKRIVVDGASLPWRLREFRLYYNHVRTHQHLDGRTPAEVWSKQRPDANKARYWHAWHDVLAGYYLPPG